MDDFLKKQVIDLRHELHMFPELSGEETETKKRLMEFLEKNTNLEVVDRGAWFYGKYTCPESLKLKESIGFRADFDAVKVFEDDSLPYASKNVGTAHKCGHDGHSAALCGFAATIDKRGADRDVYFIFQHGEETGIGAKEVSGLVLEENIKEVYAVHNYPQKELGSINIKEGTICCASTGMEITFYGTPTHASTPELGKNPAKAVSRLILDLDDMLSECGKNGLLLATVIQIQLGERAFGVSASKGSLLLTVRGEVQQEFDALIEKIKDDVEKLSKEEGLASEIIYNDNFPETYNHKKSVDKIRDIAKKYNYKLIEMSQPLRPSEDFGWFTRKTEGAIIWLGAGEEVAPLHNKDFDYNDKLIEITCDIFEKLL